MIRPKSRAMCGSLVHIMGRWHMKGVCVRVCVRVSMYLRMYVCIRYIIV